MNKGIKKLISVNLILALLFGPFVPNVMAGTAPSAKQKSTETQQISKLPMEVYQKATEVIVAFVRSKLPVMLELIKDYDNAEDTSAIHNDPRFAKTLDELRAKLQLELTNFVATKTSADEEKKKEIADDIAKDLLPRAMQYAENMFRLGNTGIGIARAVSNVRQHQNAEAARSDKVEIAKAMNMLKIPANHVVAPLWADAMQLGFDAVRNKTLSPVDMGEIDPKIIANVQKARMSTDRVRAITMPVSAGIARAFDYLGQLLTQNASEFSGRSVAGSEETKECPGVSFENFAKANDFLTNMTRNTVKQVFTDNKIPESFVGLFVSKVLNNDTICKVAQGRGGEVNFGTLIAGLKTEFSRVTPEETAWANTVADKTVSIANKNGSVDKLAFFKGYSNNPGVYEFKKPEDQSASLFLPAPGTGPVGTDNSNPLSILAKPQTQETVFLNTDPSSNNRAKEIYEASQADKNQPAVTDSHMEKIAAILTQNQNEKGTAYVVNEEQKKEVGTVVQSARDSLLASSFVAAYREHGAPIFAGQFSDEENQQRISALKDYALSVASVKLDNRMEAAWYDGAITRAIDASTVKQRCYDIATDSAINMPVAVRDINGQIVHKVEGKERDNLPCIPIKEGDDLPAVVSKCHKLFEQNIAKQDTDRNGGDLGLYDADKEKLAEADASCKNAIAAYIKSADGENHSKAQLARLTDFADHALEYHFNKRAFEVRDNRLDAAMAALMVAGGVEGFVAAGATELSAGLGFRAIAAQMGKGIVQHTARFALVWGATMPISIEKYRALNNMVPADGKMTEADMMLTATMDATKIWLTSYTIGYGAGSAGRTLFNKMVTGNVLGLPAYEYSERLAAQSAAELAQNGAPSLLGTLAKAAGNVVKNTVTSIPITQELKEGLARISSTVLGRGLNLGVDAVKYAWRMYPKINVLNGMLNPVSYASEVAQCAAIEHAFLTLTIYKYQGSEAAKAYMLDGKAFANSFMHMAPFVVAFRWAAFAARTASIDAAWHNAMTVYMASPAIEAAAQTKLLSNAAERATNSTVREHLQKQELESAKGLAGSLAMLVGMPMVSHAGRLAAGGLTNVAARTIMPRDAALNYLRDLGVDIGKNRDYIKEARDRFVGRLTSSSGYKVTDTDLKYAQHSDVLGNMLRDAVSLNTATELNDALGKILDVAGKIRAKNGTLVPQNEAIVSAFMMKLMEAKEAADKAAKGLSSFFEAKSKAIAFASATRESALVENVAVSFTNADAKKSVESFVRTEAKARTPEGARAKAAALKLAEDYAKENASMTPQAVVSGLKDFASVQLSKSAAFLGIKPVIREMLDAAANGPVSKDVLYKVADVAKNTPGVVIKVKATKGGAKVNIATESVEYLGGAFIAPKEIIEFKWKDANGYVISEAAKGKEFRAEDSSYFFGERESVERGRDYIVGKDENGDLTIKVVDKETKDMLDRDTDKYERDCKK